MKIQEPDARGRFAPQRSAASVVTQVIGWFSCGHSRHSRLFRVRMRELRGLVFALGTLPSCRRAGPCGRWMYQADVLEQTHWCGRLDAPPFCPMQEGAKQQLPPTMDVDGRPRIHRFADFGWAGADYKAAVARTARMICAAWRLCPGVEASLGRSRRFGRVGIDSHLSLRGPAAARQRAKQDAARTQPPHLQADVGANPTAASNTSPPYAPGGASRPSSRPALTATSLCTGPPWRVVTQHRTLRVHSSHSCILRGEGRHAFRFTLVYLARTRNVGVFLRFCEV